MQLLPRPAGRGARHHERHWMNDAVSEAEAASGSPDPGSDAAIAEAFGLHVQASPPLAWLAALSALVATCTNQVLLPALNSTGKRALLRQLEPWGAFAQNLAAIAGLIAVSFGLHAFVRYNTLVGLRKR